MYGTFEMMPGPTDQARALQFEQTSLVERLYAAWHGLHSSLTLEQSRSIPAVVEAQAAYNANVEALLALLGPNAMCHQVDSDLWECFHNVYKDDVGSRPYGAWPVHEVKAYLERRSVEHAAGDDVAASIRT